jgi:predicted RND superfamily exporter protein
MYRKTSFGGPGSNVPVVPQSPAMHALKDLFTSDVGLMSLAGIVFMLGMGVFYVRHFLNHMHEDEAKAAAEARAKAAQQR